MRIFNISTFNEWIVAYPDSRQALLTFKRTVLKAEWKSLIELKENFPSADNVTVKSLADTRVVFDICGNTYRLVAHVNFKKSAVFLKGFFTHGDYDKLRLDKLEF